MKIFCVKFDNGLPHVHHKCETAVHKGRDKFFTPPFSNQLDYSFHMIVKINRVGKAIGVQFAERYRDEVSVAVNLWSSSLAATLQTNGAPSDMAYTFDKSIIMPSRFFNIGDVAESRFICYAEKIKQGEVRWSEMKNCVDEAISYISNFVTLKLGDMILVDIGSISSLKSSRGGSITVALEDENIINIITN